MLVAGCGLAGGIARAQEAQPQAGTQAATQTAPGGTTQSGWFEQREMTGDWGGVRTTLKNDGIIMRGHYVAEMAGNPEGGRSQGFRYAHEIALGADIDFAKAAGIDLGTLHVTLTERAGRSLAADSIGNIESVQEIFGSGETVRITLLALQRAFGPHLDAEIGWNNAENDFAASSTYWGDSLYCEYQSNAICGMPQALAANSGYSFYPTVVPAAWAKLYPTADRAVVIGVGIYAVNPSIVNTHNGFQLGLDDATGAYIPLELGWRRGKSDDKGPYPGMYRIGGYYDTSEVKIATNQASRYIPQGTTLADLPMQSRRGRYGGWVEADQMIERDGADHDRGVVAWGTFIWGDPGTALFPWFGEAGLVRKGTVGSRPNDTLAAAFIVAALNPKLAAYEGLLARRGLQVPSQSQEMVGELNYGYEFAHWFVLRPGLQYVWHPSGENEIPNALVLDLQASVTF